MIFAISIWQIIAEFLLFLTSWILMYYFRSEDPATEAMIIIFFAFIIHVVFPSFYLLADSKFRNAYQQNGLIKSLWFALTQNFD